MVGLQVLTVDSFKLTILESNHDTMCRVKDKKGFDTTSAWVISGW